NTLGNKVIKLQPIQGFAAEASASSLILAASHFGIPISTTHVITTSIMGVGSTQGFSAVKWGLVGTIVRAWVLTIPVCMILASGLYRPLRWTTHLQRSRNISHRVHFRFALRPSPSWIIRHKEERKMEIEN